MAKTQKYLGIGANGLELTYNDEIGGSDYQLIPYSSLSSAEQTAVTALNGYITTRLNAMSPVYPTLKGVTLKGGTTGVFAITDTNGNVKIFNVADLTGANKTTSDAFFAFVLSSTGAALSTCTAIFYSGSLTINGNTVSSAAANTATGGLITQVVTMCINLFNGIGTE